MDEILIEEKKYVSSKRAAKITGYAKDYIGQLCREGRVPSRLVGRSWYVLESAIKDHRFGTKETGEGETSEDVSAGAEPATARQAEEFPRYEAAQADVLPSLNLLRKEEHTTLSLSITQDTSSVVPQEKPQNLQDSWREWFDERKPVEDTEPQRSIAEEGMSAVPLRILRPASHQAEEEEVVVPACTPVRSTAAGVDHTIRLRRGVRAAVAALSYVGALLAFSLVLLATAGSGYFDRYLVSFSQVKSLTGISVYNK